VSGSVRERELFGGSVTALSHSEFEETMNKILIVATLIVGFAGTTSAQTVLPAISETKMKKSVKGEFFVRNDGLLPMPTVIEAKEITGGQDGKPIFKAPGPDVQIDLRDSSAVIAPKSQRSFEFKITSQRTVALAFFAGMQSGKTKEGVQIRLWIPSVVYACTDSAKDCRLRTKKALGITN
jgi:hypothetical protein